MNNEYNFYCLYIKPLEKKLGFYMLLNSKFKTKFMQKKIDKINNKIVIYYKILLKNNNYRNNLIKKLNRISI